MARFYIENKGEWDHPNRKWVVEPYWLIHDGVKSVGPTRIDDPYIGEVLDSMVQAIKGTEAECEVWVNETVKRDVQIASLTAENERLRQENYRLRARLQILTGVAVENTTLDALQPKEGQCPTT